MKKKRTEITIETLRVVVINKSQPILGWCDTCQKEVDWLNLDEAACLTGASTREVIRKIECGALHSTGTRERILVVCPDSLIRAARGGDHIEASED
jgi:hypothetical protein